MLSRLAYIILALVLFIGSSGLLLNKHYCQNELKSTALFLPAKGCHTSQKPAACPRHADGDGHSEEDRKACCDDQTEWLQLDEEQVLPTFGLDLSKFFLVGAALLIAGREMDLSPHRQIIHYLNYKPPLLVRDLSLRFQTFLF